MRRLWARILDPVRGLLAALLLAAPLIGLEGGAATADVAGAGLGGYVAQAFAMAFSLQPVLPAFLSTGDVPFEATLGLTTASATSGGNSFGRAAVLWPGAAASDPGPLIAQGFGQPAVGALFPKWPLQAQATQDDGVVQTGAPPVLVMTATGYPDRSGGDSRLADVLVPGLVHIEHLASTATTSVHDADIASRANVDLEGVSLLGGQITIAHLRSWSTATSTGSASTSQGDVVISGLTVGGFSVRVTNRGFEIVGAPGGAPSGLSLPSAEQAVRSLLDRLHARLTLFRSAGRAAGGSAEWLGTALVLSIDNPVGGVGPVPPGRFDVILGSTSSVAHASPPFVAGPVTSAAGGVAQRESPSVPLVAGTLGSGPPPATGTLASVAGLASPPFRGALRALGAAQGAAYRFRGVPATLVAGLFVAAFALAVYVRRFVLVVLGGRG